MAKSAFTLTCLAPRECAQQSVHLTCGLPSVNALVLGELAGGSLAQSAAFSGFIYTQAESCFRSFIHARPPASIPLTPLGGDVANHWAAGHHEIGKII